MRMEACSPLAARHIAGAQDCEYDIAWTNTYLVGIDYTATATGSNLADADPGS